jgi:dipeptidyl aminopeptidase/acylaminoacyl peptidase
MPQEITYPGMDGTPVPALLFKSEGADENTPAVVVIHGGPNWHFQVEWYPFMIHLASRGWTVISPNYRGSTGYGRDWQYAIRFDIGGIDTDDVTAGVKYLLDNKLADPKRIAVTGRSHGGYLTMSCLTRYPDLWCAGSAVVPFLNWFTGHENSREDLQHWDFENFGNPEDNYDLWYERSPFFFLDQVKAPVQLICGENDPRCPASESIEARDKLLSYGCKVDFALYEGEGHGFLKIENVVDSELRRADFLAKALE